MCTRYVLSSLTVPPEFRQRVVNSYSDIYDELCDGGDIPKLLYELKKNME